MAELLGPPRDPLRVDVGESLDRLGHIRPRRHAPEYSRQDAGQRRLLLACECVQVAVGEGLEQVRAV